MTEEAIAHSEFEALIAELAQALEQANRTRLQKLCAVLDSTEAASVLESFHGDNRLLLWKHLPVEIRGEALAELGEVALASLVQNLSQQEVVEAVVTLDSHDLAEVVAAVDDTVADAIRAALGQEERKTLDSMMAYPEDTVGRLIDTGALTVRADVTLETVLRFLRSKEALPEHTSALIVIDRDGHFLGELPLSDLLTSETSSLVSTVMDTEVIRISPEMSHPELAQLFRQNDLVSVAVVDANNKLLGRVSLDEMVDVIHEEADHQIMAAVGLDEEEDLFAPVLTSASRRLLWLGVNLATAFLTAWMIGLFEATLDKIVALAILMPIVASMGGIAGGQTLTLIIRGLVTGTITSANARWLAYKEIVIAMISGLTWAVVVGAIAYWWFGDMRISIVLAAAMVFNLLVAAISGYAIPMLMKKVGIDPALAGGVVLTTITDVAGFVSFLGLASWYLL